MKAGSIVECIDDKFGEKANRYLQYRPVAGQLYIVRRITEDSLFNNTEGFGVLLEEIENLKHWFWSDIAEKYFLLEPRFYMWRFREVQPPMDMEMLLSDVKEESLVG